MNIEILKYILLQTKKMKMTLFEIYLIHLNTNNYVILLINSLTTKEITSYISLVNTFCNMTHTAFFRPTLALY